MKHVAFACLGVIGIGALVLGTSKGANAQDREIDSKNLPELFSSAPPGGIAMLQDKDSVYIYDGKSQKLIVVSKNYWEGDDSKPRTRVVNIAKMR